MADVADPAPELATLIADQAREIEADRRRRPAPRDRGGTVRESELFAVREGLSLDHLPAPRQLGPGFGFHHLLMGDVPWEGAVHAAVRAGTWPSDSKRTKTNDLAVPGPL